VDDIDWAPDGGAQRAVPACTACATRIADGEEPLFRMIAAASGAMPYFASPGRARYYQLSGGLDAAFVSSVVELLGRR
jgi:hypothetical protein